MSNIKDNLKKSFDEACLAILPTAENTEGIQFLTKVYTEMFKEYPNVISIAGEGYYLNRDAEDLDNFDEDDDDLEYNEEDAEKGDIYTFDNIFMQQTMCNAAEYYKDSAYIYRTENYPTIIADHLFIFWSSYYREIYIMQNSPELSDEVKNLIVDKKNDKEHRWFSYVTSTSQGFSETSLKCKKQNIDLKMNYNDDLPHDKIIEFLKSNNSGLILLHGEPGTGKTTYIRHLMYELKGRHFMVMDASVFRYITDASFIDLLLDNKNAVIILEDCETMLSDRMTTGNQMLSTLLNLSDGIIGDSMNFKFICTFNAPIGKLDQAIQRKGRMKVKYEFKKLTAEKTHALGEKLGFNIPKTESLPLSEIFNYNEDNGKEKETKKIGFSK